jgi:hypothetical protein
MAFLVLGHYGMSVVVGTQEQRMMLHHVKAAFRHHDAIAGSEAVLHG